jgi:hypothetical protein
MTIKDRIINALISAGLSPVTAAYAFAQAAHETGNFTSVLYLTNNNCFGMKMPKLRSTTADKEQLGYAHYKTIEDSAKDYALWYKFVRLPGGLQTVDQFVNGLHSKAYFEAPLEEYVNGVKRWHKFYFNE